MAALRISWTPFLSAAAILLCAAVAYMGMGFFDAAQAVSAPLDASCNRLNTYGFTTGLVYCVETSVGNAVTLYAGIMQTKLLPYEGMALAVAIVVFGIKMMNSDFQNPIKETSGLVFRVMLGVFFYHESVAIYKDIAGPGGIISEGIGWVTGLTSSSGGSGNNIFANLIIANCTKPTAPSYYQGEQIWQAFDCMFSKIFGAATTSTDGNQTFFTSMLVIIGASLFSATLGVIVAGLGLSLFVGVLLFVIRALFLVLMSYICVGFLAIFSPLISPLLFFDSEYLTEKFKNWGGIIISSIFQPIFVVGFLGLTITVDDLLIEGNLAGCIPPTYPVSGSTLAGAPALGYGQDGSGVCSFMQLVDNGQSGTALQKSFNDFMQQDNTLFTMSVARDPQGSQVGTSVTPYDPINNNLSGQGVAKTNVINQVHQFVASNSATFEPGGTTRLKKYFPMKQLLLTMLTFIMVNFAMKSLMETVPAMAANMTIGASVNLMQQMQVPFEDTVKNFMAGADGAMMNAAQKKGVEYGNMKGLRGFGDALLAGARGGAGNVIKNN